MFTMKNDLSCIVAFAIKNLPSEFCLTLCKLNVILPGFKRIQIFFFFLINILLFLAKYKHFTAFYTYTNLSDDLQILSTVSYLET